MSTGAAPFFRVRGSVQHVNHKRFAGVFQCVHDSIFCSSVCLHRVLLKCKAEMATTACGTCCYTTTRSLKVSPDIVLIDRYSHLFNFTIDSHSNGLIIWPINLQYDVRHAVLSVRKFSFRIQC
ncbi:hypothetical protein L596_000158 [Steinernema carpocapsae]|uniref:Uncharacterized protein n=1 Tax=Steinernema carpocapsae TaxID=34508 RepID=A0A4U8UJG8_STECR|nr:hypothetical protein L596_000158 [Steinernema carpocapsae]